MGSNNFIQKAELFSFMATKCLRNSYYHNDCHLCIDICPENALKVVRNKLTLFDNECINCAGCIGSCPTEALKIESFDPNVFTLEFDVEKNSTISCKKNTTCLGVFDYHHFISMGINSDKDFTCDLSHCLTCNLNRENLIESKIRKNIDTSNKFLTDIGAENSILIQEELETEDENARRALFRSAIDKVKDIAVEKEEEFTIVAEHNSSIKSPLPLKYKILKESIKANIEKIEKKVFDKSTPIFFEKSIEFDKCTNCGDCVQFCPSEALSATSDKQGINFAHASCIGCDICDDICKVDAISSKDGFDLVNIAYDRVDTLVYYEMVVCQECKCPYPYRGGEPICDRCSSFTANFADMFTLAKDM